MSINIKWYGAFNMSGLIDTMPMEEALQQLQSLKTYVSHMQQIAEQLKDEELENVCIELQIALEARIEYVQNFVRIEGVFAQLTELELLANKYKEDKEQRIVALEKKTKKTVAKLPEDQQQALNDAHPELQKGLNNIAQLVKSLMPAQQKVLFNEQMYTKRDNEELKAKLFPLSLLSSSKLDSRLKSMLRLLNDGRNDRNTSTATALDEKQEVFQKKIERMRTEYLKNDPIFKYVGNQHLIDLFKSQKASSFDWAKTLFKNKGTRESTELAKQLWLLQNALDNYFRDELSYQITHVDSPNKERKPETLKELREKFDACKQAIEAQKDGKTFLLASRRELMLTNLDEAITAAEQQKPAKKQRL